MRLLITGGGTGGHIYPALAVVEELLANPEWATTHDQLAWVGTTGSIEERVLNKEGMAFCPISAGALRGAGPLKALRNAGRLLDGYRQCHRLVREFRPQAVLATGGYVSAPLVLAARVAGCPTLIYLPDMEPGLAVKWLARVATRVAVSFEPVTAHFARGKAIVSGYPVRRDFYAWQRDKARQALDLDGEGPLLLVFGGSRGAHSLNMAVHNALESILRLCQVVHITGYDDYQTLLNAKAQLAEQLRGRYHLFAYVYEQMAALMAAADLCVARAGAATLGEFPAAGLPAVLVPYPYAGQHQTVNAAYLVQKGAAVILPDDELNARLLTLVTDLLHNTTQLQQMRAAAQACANPQAAHRIAQELCTMAKGGVQTCKD